MNEWRDIPGFPGYQVNESGALRRSEPARGAIVGKVLRYHWYDGYRKYNLRLGGRTLKRRASQLVALAFLGPKPFAGAEVCHNDGVRSNDHYRNLRWDTREGNFADMRAHGTRLVGERSPLAKLTRAKVELIPLMRKAGYKQRQIATLMGVAQTTISKIENGKRWR